MLRGSSYKAVSGGDRAILRADSARDLEPPRWVRGSIPDLARGAEEDILMANTIFCNVNVIDCCGSSGFIADVQVQGNRIQAKVPPANIAAVATAA